MDFNNVAILSIKGNGYRIHVWYMSKDDAIILMKSYNLNKKNWIVITFLSLYIKDE